MKTKKFVHFDSDGNPWGIVSTERLWANVYAIKYNKPENRLGKDIWRNLFEQAKAAAIEFGAESIESRIRLEYDPALFQEIHGESGFRKKSGRIEYQSALADLPDDQGTPLLWKTAHDLNWDLSQIAKFTKEIVEGALDIDPNENPEDFIQDWLQHHEFTSGLPCIAIGFDKDVPCALAVAQVNKSSGWSRISYMGILPRYRGKGLGKWVHRHGFTMMKQQGGKLYHGGTLVNNFAMKKLFEAHRCRVFCEMEEWTLSVKGGQP